MAVNDREIKMLLDLVKGDDLPDISLAGVDISRLLRLAYRHKVIYPMLLFAKKYPESFTKEQIQQLDERNRRVARKSLIQLQELKKIVDVFAENEISFACIKGPQLSRMLYGHQAIKESVDLDILLTEDNRRRLQMIHSLLEQMGYTQSNLNEYPGKWRRKIFLIAKREIHYFNSQTGCAIDLHIRPGANTYLTAKNFRGFLNELKTFDLDCTRVPVLPDESYFVYLCYHGALHQFMRLAWLLDIRAFLQLKYQTLELNKVARIARALNVERSVHLALLLLKQYFGDDYKMVSQLKNKSSLIQQLANRCYSMLGCDPGYPLSLKGRFDKVVYIMKLVKGLRGKIDWFYGILTRQLIKLIRY